MLTHLHVNQFTLVDQLDLELHRGLTVLTGETGAGKSVLLDALGLALGDRADADKVRAGSERAEVSASFDIRQLPYIQQWLNAAGLHAEDECILRRVVTKEGRSRAYINGQTVPLGQLRELGDKLLDIHSQHEHQSLLKTGTHRRLLDAFGQSEAIAAQVSDAFQWWHESQLKLLALRNDSTELNARYQLLRYQVDELDQLAIEQGELQHLEARQQQLANAELIQQNCQHVSDICGGDEASVQDRLNRALYLLRDLPGKSDRISEAEAMLHNALIQVEEAQRELDRHISSFELTDDSLADIEQRLSALYEIARKHRVPPEQLPDLHEQLATELQGLQSADDQIEILEQQVKEALARYHLQADKLTNARRKAAKGLSKAVNRQLQKLAMERAEMEIVLLPTTTPTKHGQESVEFLISTVPGQPPKPLSKIASGGELSRISLAIQVITAKTSTTPTLVFDEVDVGIGGATGDVVGMLLRELGQSTQVLCVTHLAQVASKAHHHLSVTKQLSKHGASTKIEVLAGEDKILEIARMMGGPSDSAQSLAHAREMVECKNG